MGDVSEVAPALADSLRGAFKSADSRAEIEAAWAEWRAEKRSRAEKGRKGAIDPAAVAESLSKHIPDDAIISVDVGNIAYSFGRYFEAKEQTFIGSWYLGSIGFGLPAAIGAWCAAQEPDGEFFGRPVAAIVGDGGLGQYLADWTTVAKYGMNIKCVVYNNSELAKIPRNRSSPICAFGRRNYTTRLLRSLQNCARLPASAPTTPKPSIPK